MRDSRPSIPGADRSPGTTAAAGRSPNRPAAPRRSVAVPPRWSTDEQRYGVRPQALAIAFRRSASGISRSKSSRVSSNARARAVSRVYATYVVMSRGSNATGWTIPATCAEVHMKLRRRPGTLELDRHGHPVVMGGPQQLARVVAKRRPGKRLVSGGPCDAARLVHAPSAATPARRRGADRTAWGRSTSRGASRGTRCPRTGSRWRTARTSFARGSR